MKIALFNDHRPGLIKGDNVVDISSQVPLGRNGQETIVNIIDGWDALKPKLEAVPSGQTGVPLSSVKLRAPVPKPGKIMCMAANYREGTDKPPLPINGFLVSPDAVLDPEGTTTLPEYEFTIATTRPSWSASSARRARTSPRATRTATSSATRRASTSQPAAPGVT